MNEKTYKCECGREFTKPNSFNAHKSNCRIHFEMNGKDFDAICKTRGKGVSKSLTKRNNEIKETNLQVWISEEHRCEKCGKIMTQKYGSGRFCSQQCANSHEVTNEWRTNTSNAMTGKNITVEEFIDTHPLLNRENTIYCPVCNRSFYNDVGLRAHLNACKRKHNVPIYAKSGSDELDITQEELNRYISKQVTCEICGKSVEDAVKYTGKQAAKRLCIDHDHSTNHFRGMLCQVCNRQLGWYEKYKDKVDTYLNKSNGSVV